MKRLIKFHLNKKSKNEMHQSKASCETGSTYEMSAYFNPTSGENSPVRNKRGSGVNADSQSAKSIVNSIISTSSISDINCTGSGGDEDEDEEVNDDKRHLSQASQDASESTTSSCRQTNSEENYPMATAFSTLVRHGGVQTNRALSYRAKIIESIVWLGRHMPRCVLAQLIDEITSNRRESANGNDLGYTYHYYRSKTTQSGYGEREEKKVKLVARDLSYSPSSKASSRRLLDNMTKNQDAKMGFATCPLPNVDKYQSALLFIDISGFTALSVLLDVESLSKAINDYFQMIVDSVISHGGDILKFAGDALFAEWRVVTEEGNDKSKGAILTIDDCVLIAATCGAKVVAECSDYPIYSTTGLGGIEGEQIAALNVHCGLGVGELTSVHVGNFYKRRELLVLGDPINQVSKAEGAASLGELAASPEAVSFLNETCDLTNVSMQKGVPMVIASRKKQYFSPRKREIKNMSQSVKAITNTMSFNFENMDTLALVHLQKQIALYVHPIIVQSETSNNSFNMYSSLAPQKRESEAERYRAEAELRSVYTMFIMPLISTERSDDMKDNMKLYQLLNDIMNLVTDTLETFMGHLRQFIVDDKGVVLIATFGLRGSTTPNMIIERAIPATQFLHRALKTVLCVDNQIGGTIGKAYCGVVGGMLRHEYAVLGPSVNLAARLMSLPKHPGILVDDEVKKKAGKKANFRPLDAVKAKGYEHLVPIYQPLTATERRWGAVNPNFVGRKAEVGMVINLATEMASSISIPAKMLFLVGDTGSGKSSVVVQSIAVLSKIMPMSGKNIIVTRNVSNEGESHVPFSLFRCIFRDILCELQMQPDDYASGDDASSYEIGSLLNKDWDKMSLAGASTSRSESSSTLDRITYLCKEIGAPKGFLEIVGHHLLGHTKQDDVGGGKNAKMDEVIKGMADAFARCTCHSSLVVLVMDDVHNVDRMSWKVVRKLFETCDNLLILCGSRPFTSYPPKTGNIFWSALNDQYAAEGRFQVAELGPMPQRDITEMISKCFDCLPIEVDETLSKIVFKQSGGMPYYASEILTNISRQNMCERRIDGKLAWRRTADMSLEPSISFVSLDELIVNRIDNLDDNVREILFIAAALGAVFELSELLAVYEQIYSISPTNRVSATSRVCDIVEMALKEKILEESFGIVTADDYDDANLDNTVDLNAVAIALDRFDIPEIDPEDNGFVNMQYRFHHDIWRRNILALLLDSRKRDILRNAGIVLEMLCKDGKKTDYRSMLRLFGYWKESGHTLKAAELALAIGKKFTSLGLNSDSIDMYTTALTMWQKNTNDNSEEIVCGFPTHVLDTIDVKTSKIIVLLLISKGQAHGNLLEGKEGVVAYRNAFQISKREPLCDELDRTFIFPIFSGMQFFLKYGFVVEPQHEIAYEQELVANFMYEARHFGNPIHISRALAMEVDFYCLAGQYKRALNSHSLLEEIYDVDEHSALICEAYGSDRSAQSFGFCARCYCHLENIEKALEVCDHVVRNLMPKMKITNTHNSFVLLYPILWIWKDNDLAVEALSIFRKYIVEAFNEHYGKGATTPALSFFKPIEILLAIFTNELSKEAIQEYITWVQDMNKIACVPNGINRSMLRFGRCANSIFAEICLLLSQRCDEKEVRKNLITDGLKHACVALEWAEGKDGSPRHQSAYDQAKPVYDQLIRGNQPCVQ